MDSGIAPRSEILPDVLESGLRVVFCGTAAGYVSERSNAYYAHSNNRFWKTLHEVGLTSEQLLPSDFRRVVEFGIGLTDLCKDTFGLDSDIRRPTHADREALRQKLQVHQPKVVAFTSLTAGRSFCGTRTTLGLQDELIGSTRVFVLPSTSPMAAWNWASTAHHWSQLADLVR